MVAKQDGIELWKSYCEQKHKVFILTKFDRELLVAHVMGERSNCLSCADLTVVQEGDNPQVIGFKVTSAQLIIPHKDGIIEYVNSVATQGLILKFDDMEPNLQTLFSFKRNGIQFRILRGDISDCDIDGKTGIACAISSRLTVGKGLALHLFKKGGSGLYQQCSDWLTKNESLKEGSVMSVDGGRLGAKKVFLVNIKKWSGGVRKEKVLLQSMYTTLFQSASGENICNLAFPLLGTGYNQYPLIDAINCLFVAFAKFVSGELDNSPLKIIDLVLADEQYIKFAVNSANDTLSLIAGGDMSVNQGLIDQSDCNKLFCAQWTWMQGGNRIAYDSELNMNIEAAFKAGNARYRFEIGNSTYEIDFNRMVQVNKSSGYQRLIKRELTKAGGFRTVDVMGTIEDVQDFCLLVTQKINVLFSY
ncbi:macro domain-containing protein [Acrasis kona]|uniref:Macro domain-containing protein n=1 Tax=Acrasis kona TaxID=1008807 RepID=A0AAW2YK16_9EUKA